MHPCAIKTTQSTSAKHCQHRRLRLQVQQATVVDQRKGKIFIGDNRRVHSETNSQQDQAYQELTVHHGHGKTRLLEETQQMQDTCQESLPEEDEQESRLNDACGVEYRGE